MLKMTGHGHKNGRPIQFIVLGLSRVNIERLQQGQPIHFLGPDVGLDPSIDFMIFAGDTEASMHHELQGLVGPDTIIHVSGRLKP